jgi:hypothetical protein
VSSGLDAPLYIACPICGDFCCLSFYEEYFFFVVVFLKSFNLLAIFIVNLFVYLFFRFTLEIVEF